MNNYWREREEEKLKLDDVLIDEQISKISLLMDDVISRIDTEISKLYLKYSKDNGVSYHEALVYLKDNERKEFQRDLKYYIESCKNTDKLDKYRQELQALSTRARVKRLEVIQAKIRMSATDIESFLRHDNVKIMNDIYTENFLHSIFSIEGAKGIDIKFNMPNADKVEKLLQHPWSGKNYSQKIWDTTGNFVSNMDSILTTGLIQGKSYKAISRELELAKVGKTGNGGLKYQCERLVRTEAAFIAEQATKDSYEKYGVEEYEYSATLDLRTSEICSELDNKVFKVSEAITGVNYPPMHVHCRSTTVPIVKWEGEEDDEDIRIYRNPLTGENNFAKFKDYAEWKDEQYKKYGEDKVTAEQKKIRNKASDKLQFDKYKAVLEKKDLPGTFAEFQELKYNNVNEWVILKEFYKYKIDNPGSNKTYFLIDKRMQELRDSGIIRIKGTVIKPEWQEIRALNEHTLMRMNQRGITEEDSQSFIDNSIIAFKQRLGAQHAYYSEKGFTAISTDGGVGSTGWLDENGRLIIKEAKKILWKK